jgi:hypothetical protein
MNPHRMPARFVLRRLPTAAALACGLLLAACGGGDAPATSTSTPLSQPDATADSANSSQTGTDVATSLATVYDTTAALAQASAQPAAASSNRMRAQATGAPVTNATVSCAGGGTATLTITGGTLASQLNGQLDAGEHYSVTYAQCTGAAGYAQQDGGVEMDVVSVASSSTPATTAVNLAVTKLTLSLPSGSAALDGSATLTRTTAVADGVTTTTSHASVPSATLTTHFNSRSGSFTLSELDATRTVQSVAGVATASQYNGHHTLSGTANGRTFSMTVSTTGDVSYDATGVLVSGQWTVVRPKATIVTVVANGSVVLTVDDGNDGTIDHTWTFSTAQLNATAG